MPARRLREAASRFAQWALGGTCLLCRGAAERGLLCEPCDAELPRLPRALCPRCALPSPRADVCGRCLAEPPRFDATLAALEYVFPVDVLVQALKFRGELALAGLLASVLAERVRGAPPVQYVLPVPLAGARLRERGYNQSLEIARYVARAMRVTLAPDLCARTSDTRAQTGLAWSERATNVRGAFRARARLDGAVIAVLDDVMTTGATLDEIAATLKRAGAAQVVNWVVARTFPPEG
jgi:ComF family protein